VERFHVIIPFFAGKTALGIVVIDLLFSAIDWLRRRFSFESSGTSYQAIHALKGQGLTKNLEKVLSVAVVSRQWLWDATFGNILVRNGWLLSCIAYEHHYGTAAIAQG